jgi:hypothetical protein
MDKLLNYRFIGFFAFGIDIEKHCVLSTFVFIVNIEFGMNGNRKDQKGTSINSVGINSFHFP